MEIEEDKYTCESDYRALVPDGIYDAECLEFNRNYIETRPKLFLRFRLLNEPYQHIELPMCFNMRHDGLIPLGSKYYKAWVKVHGRLPSRNATMAPRLFLNKSYRVRTKTVKPKDGKDELPDFFHYSVVESILSVTDQG